MPQSTCPYCRTEVVYEAWQVGQELTCPACFGRFLVETAQAISDSSPGSDASLGESGIPSAALPRAETQLRRWIWILTGVAVFLVGLILAVSAGRYVRAYRTAGKPTPLASETVPSEASPSKWTVQLQTAKDPVARYKALEAIVAEGPEAVCTALDTLVKTSEDGNVFQIPQGVVETWVEFGSAGVESLAAALQSDKPNVRAGAAYVLSKLGGQAKPALAALAEVLQDTHPRVRWYALEALAGMGTASGVVLDKVRPLLDHPDRLTRRRALVVLARIGPKAKSLLLQVQKLQKEDPDPSVRQTAELAARQLNLETLVQEAIQNASEDIQPLIKQLQTGSPYESAAAARALGKMGPEAAEALPALVLALYQEDKWVREAAVQAIGAIGREARAYRDALVAATLDAEPEVRQAAQEALDKIEGRKPVSSP